MKTFAKVLIPAVALAAMAWCSLFIYWHLRISSAIRRLAAETETAGAVQSDSFLFLRHGAGCRALPYLVSALDPRRPPPFLERATLLIAIEVDEPRIKGDRWSPHDNFGWRINLDDSPEELRKKCERVREFWRQNGSRHHQTWRVWSRACVPND